MLMYYGINRNYFCSEELGDDNPWFCSSCQSQQKATRTLTVHHIPPVLIIHLKRLDVCININNCYTYYENLAHFPSSVVGLCIIVVELSLKCQLSIP